MTAGRPTDYTPELLQKAQGFLNEEHESAAFLSVAGLAHHLGIARSTIYDWASHEDKKEFSDIIEKILTAQELYLTSNGLSGKYNSTITKLMLTKHGYTDKQETDLTSKGESISPLTVKFINGNDNGDTVGV